ncbi:MAG: DUF4870 domain-containing protein [Deltaproteobacteria bacterium]|nr:DUF4870 domain-containing protein [Deltaproteobacteria bacterium]
MEQHATSQGGQNPAYLWAMICHLSALTGLIIPFGSLIGPIIVWQIKRKEFPFVEDQGKEAVNFQLSVFLYLLASLLLIWVGIGLVLLWVGAIGAFVFTVIAAIKANQGIPYRYPLKIAWIK